MRLGFELFDLFLRMQMTVVGPQVHNINHSSFFNFFTDFLFV